MSAKIATSSVLLGLALAGSTANAAVTTNLQGYYKLDETSNTAGTTVVNDGTAAEDGAIVNVAAVGQAGIVGTSYLYEDGLAPGGNDSATAAKANLTPATSQIADNLAVLLTSGGAATADTTGVNRLSLSLWIRPTDNKAPTTGANGRNILVAQSADFQFTLQNSAGSSTGGAVSSDTAADLFFNFRNAAAANVPATSDNNALGITVPVGTDAPYTHVAVTRDAGTFTFFINGVQVSQTTGLSTDPFYSRAYDNDGDAVANEYNLMLGTTNSTTRDFDGNLDETGIWVDHVVTPVEFAAIAGLGRFSGAGLDNSGIDAVIAVHAAGTGQATVNGDAYEYQTVFPDEGTRLLGEHFSSGGVDYIILGGTAGNYTGVSTVVPEPTSLAAIAGLAGLALRRRRR